MSKTALLFAGQGAQVVGMGKDLSEEFPDVFAKLKPAADSLGIGLTDVCFNGPEDQLTRTEFAQPGIYFASWLCLEALRSRVGDLKFDATAGLSLGEFTALAAAGAMSFEDGLKVVHLRGRYMQEACDETDGLMAAIIGLDRDATQAICDEAGVELANLNCPGQLVISGETAKIHAACELAKAKGAKRALPIKVAGAYHSKLMTSAASKLGEALDGIAVSAPAVPVISNVTAAAHVDPSSIRSLLVQQVTSPVRWEDSIRAMIADGFTRFIELGPGNTLCGFMKRIDSSVEALNVSNAASLEKAVEVLTAA